MRTTLTLEPDVAAMVERERLERKSSLKDIVNEALRKGLTEARQPSRQTANYATPSVDLGQCLLASLDDVSEALAVAEGDRFR